MTITTACAECGEKFEAANFRALYCTDAHRKRASRRRAKERAEAQAAAAAGAGEPVTDDSAPTDPTDPTTEIFDAAFAELQTAKKERTALGLSALALARQMDLLKANPGALPGQMPAQFAAAMARAHSGSSNTAAAGPLAEILGGAGGLVAIRGGRR